MLRHWGRPYYYKRINQKRTNSTTAKSEPAFPFNYTEYRNSGKQAEYESIWMKALNLSNGNQNKSQSANQVMPKSHLLADMMEDTPVHPHSFATVMAIASLFLFFTLGITVTLIIFCRKKNVVFALQKSEQEDELDYELDDLEMDTHTDVEYGSDEESDQRYSAHNIYVHNTDSPCRKPLMCDANDDDINHSRIYRPNMDTKGAYQAMEMAIQNETEQHRISERSRSESALLKRHPRFFSYNVRSYSSKNTAALFLANSLIQSSKNAKVPLSEESHSDESINIETSTQEAANSNGLELDNGHNSLTSRSYHSSVESLKGMNNSETVSSNTVELSTVESHSCDAAKNSDDVSCELEFNGNTHDADPNMRYSAHEAAMDHSVSKRDSTSMRSENCTCKALCDQSPTTADSYRLDTNQNSAQRQLLRNNNVTATAPYKYNPNNPFHNDIYSTANEPSSPQFSYSNQTSDGVSESCSALVMSKSRALTRTQGLMLKDGPRLNTLQQHREHWVTFDQQ